MKRNMQFLALAHFFNNNLKASVPRQLPRQNFQRADACKFFRQGFYIPMVTQICQPPINNTPAFHEITCYVVVKVKSLTVKLIYMYRFTPPNLREETPNTCHRYRSLLRSVALSLLSSRFTISIWLQSHTLHLRRVITSLSPFTPFYIRPLRLKLFKSAKTLSVFGATRMR